MQTQQRLLPLAWWHSLIFPMKTWEVVVSVDVLETQGS